MVLDHWSGPSGALSKIGFPHSRLSMPVMHERNEQPTPFMAIVALHECSLRETENSIFKGPFHYFLYQAHLNYCFFAKDKSSLLHVYLREEFIIVISSSISFPLPNPSLVVNLLLWKHTYIYIYIYIYHTIITIHQHQ